MQTMSYMYKDGFLPTSAPLFMDEVMVLVALLPFLLVFSISLAKKRKIKAHITSQVVIYVVGVLAVLYFEYGARNMGGFGKALAHSGINHIFLYTFLVFHILVASASLILWTYTIYYSLKNRKKLSSKEFRTWHLKIVRPTFFTIVMTSITGIMLYIFMYLF